MYDQVLHQLSRAAREQDGLIKLKVTSRSMQPMLQVGCHVVVQPKPSKKLQSGDMIVWERGSTPGSAWNTHRVVKLIDHGWVTKGDALWDFDRPVTENEILGIVTQVTDGGRTWNMQISPWKEMNSWLGSLSALEGSILQNAGGTKLIRRMGLLLVLPLRTLRYCLVQITKILSKVENS